jgi:hypothetical protein
LRFRNLILAALLGLSVPAITRGTDIPIFPTGPNYPLKGLAWGTSIQPGFNNNYWFPVTTNSVCVYVENNNPTNAHPFTISISTTSDPDETTPSDGSWQIAAQNTATAGASVGFPAGIGVNISGVALVSINLSGSTTLGGSPDTADVNIVQTNGNCFSGNSSIGSAPNSVSAVPPIQIISEGLSQAFLGPQASINPAGTAVVEAVNNNVVSAKNIYLDKIILTCSAACSGNIIAISNTGTGGGSASPLNLKLGNLTTSVATFSFAQTVLPTAIGTITNYQLGAGQTLTIDLRGVIAPQGTANGVEVVVGTFTGTISSTFFWYEK